MLGPARLRGQIRNSPRLNLFRHSPCAGRTHSCVLGMMPLEARLARLEKAILGEWEGAPGGTDEAQFVSNHLLAAELRRPASCSRSKFIRNFSL